MSGDLTLVRAKRSRFFAKPHKSQFDGNETQHVKGNLTASVDGSYSVVADSLDLDVGTIDMNDAIVSNVKNVLRTEKTTIAHSALTKTASQYVKIYRASPGDTVFNQFGNLTAAFGRGASLMRTRVEVGAKADPNGFGVSVLATPEGWKWTTESYSYKGAYFYNASRDRVPKSFAAGADLYALVTASDMFLASLDAGSIDIYLDVMSRA